MKPHLHGYVHACELAGLRPEGVAGLPAAPDFASRDVLIVRPMPRYGSAGRRALAARLGGLSDARREGWASVRKPVPSSILQLVGDSWEVAVP